MTAIDPVTLAVLRGRLEQIADEMDATLFRAAFNPIIAEAHDASHGLYHATTGATLVQGKSGLPIFVGVMSFGVQAVLDRTNGGRDAKPGDVWIFNDCWEGGTHLSDVRLVRPHFHDGEIFCWLASVGHWHDLGGAVPGNYNASATEAFQEAFVMPPVKLIDGGRLNEDIVAIFRANTRQPVSMRGDLEGQIAALDLGAKRLDALIAEYGATLIRDAFAELTARAETLMRARIAALPDGVYRAADHLDNDGVVDRELTLTLDVTVRGDELTLDFSRSSPACAGPVNISRATTIAACYVALKHLFPDVPANAGVLAPVTIRIADGSFLAAEFPRPTGGYTETILRLIDVAFQAFAQIVPDHALACAYGTINALSISGRRENGDRFVMFSFFGGGHGAHADGDGLNHGNAPISMATIPPVEILEASYPVLFRQWALRPDSGGAGAHRGGLGAIYEIELAAPEADAFFFGERGKHGPPGAAGGENAARNRFLYPTPEGPREPPMISKMVGIKLKKGDRLRLETPGGGGHGDARARNADAVSRDLALGYVSEDGARAYRGGRAS